MRSSEFFLSIQSKNALYVLKENEFHIKYAKRYTLHAKSFNFLYHSKLNFKHSRVL